MWEKRYGLIRPARTAGGTRHYSLEELRKLFAVTCLLNDKLRISQLKDFSLHELESEVEKLRDRDVQLRRSFQCLVIAMYELDFENFSDVIDSAIRHFDANTVVEKIILPFLDKTGLKWRGRKLAEEHFAVTTIRNKLICLIEAQKTTVRNDKSVLLFLPDTRQLDLLLLLTHFRLQRAGFAVIYLGYDVTFENLETIMRLCQPDFSFTYLPGKSSFDLKRLSQLAADIKPDLTCLVAYNLTPRLSDHLPNIVIDNYDSILSHLN